MWPSSPSIHSISTAKCTHFATKNECAHFALFASNYSHIHPPASLPPTPALPNAIMPLDSAQTQSSIKGPWATTFATDHLDAAIQSPEVLNTLDNVIAKILWYKRTLEDEEAILQNGGVSTLTSPSSRKRKSVRTHQRRPRSRSSSAPSEDGSDGAEVFAGDIPMTDTHDAEHSMNVVSPAHSSVSISSHGQSLSKDDDMTSPGARLNVNKWMSPAAATDDTLVIVGLALAAHEQDHIRALHSPRDSYPPILHPEPRRASGGSSLLDAFSVNLFRTRKLHRNLLPPTTTFYKNEVSRLSANLSAFVAYASYNIWRSSRDDILAFTKQISSSSAVGLSTSNSFRYPRSSGFLSASTFRKYVHRLLDATDLNATVVMVMLWYIYVLKMRSNISAAPAVGSEYRIVTVALILAHTFLDDHTYTTAAWAKICKIFDVKEIVGMKVEFLKILQHKLVVPLNEFSKWLRIVSGWVDIWGREAANELRNVRASPTSVASPAPVSASPVRSKSQMGTNGRVPATPAGPHAVPVPYAAPNSADYQAPNVLRHTTTQVANASAPVSAPVPVIVQQQQNQQRQPLNQRAHLHPSSASPPAQIQIDTTPFASTHTFPVHYQYAPRSAGVAETKPNLQAQHTQPVQQSQFHPQSDSYSHHNLVPSQQAQQVRPDINDNNSAGTRRAKLSITTALDNQPLPHQHQANNGNASGFHFAYRLQGTGGALGPPVSPMPLTSPFATTTFNFGLASPFGIVDHPNAGALLAATTLPQDAWAVFSNATAEGLDKVMPMEPLRCSFTDLSIASIGTSEEDIAASTNNGSSSIIMLPSHPGHPVFHATQTHMHPQMIVVQNGMDGKRRPSLTFMPNPISGFIGGAAIPNSTPIHQSTSMISANMNAESAIGPVLIQQGNGAIQVVSQEGTGAPGRKRGAGTIHPNYPLQPSAHPPPHQP